MPKLVQSRAYSSIIQLGEPLSAEHNDVDAWKVCLEPESFPNLPFDTVALNGKPEVLLRENQTDPGVAHLIGGRQDQKIPVRNFQLYFIEDPAVIRRSQ